jgi:hypothetical protein
LIETIIPSDCETDILQHLTALGVDKYNVAFTQRITVIVVRIEELL